MSLYNDSYRWWEWANEAKALLRSRGFWSPDEEFGEYGGQIVYFNKNKSVKVVIYLNWYINWVAVSTNDSNSPNRFDNLTIAQLEDVIRKI